MRRRTTIIRGEEEGEETVAIYPIRSDLVPYYPIPVHPNLHPFPVLSFPPVTPWDALQIQLNPLPPFPPPSFLSFLPFLPFPPAKQRKKERINHPSPSPNSEDTRAQQPNRKKPPRARPTPNPSPTMKRTQYGTEWSKPQYPDRNRLNIFFMRAS